MSVLYLIGLGIASSSCSQALAGQGRSAKSVTAKEILMTTSTQALYSLSWVRYELLISNRLTVCEQMSP